MQNPVSTLNIPSIARSAIWGQLYGSSYSLAIAEAATKHSGLSCLITCSVQEALKLEHELNFFIDSNIIKVLSFPDWETLPYDLFSPHQDIISQRLSTLYQLPNTNKAILIIAITSLLQRLPPKEYIYQNSLILSKGQVLDFNDLRLQLEHSGYQAVSQVMEHGEFSVRGSLMDIYPSGSNKPYRIDLFDDEIETIKQFDPRTQLSIKDIDSINLLPAREFPLTSDSISFFRSQYRDRFEGNPQNSVVYQAVSNGNPFPGCEYYIPLFFQQTETLFDYLPAETLIIQQQGIDAELDRFMSQIDERFQQRRHNIERPLLPPDAIWISSAELNSALQNFQTLHIQSHEKEILQTNKQDIHNFQVQPVPLIKLDFYKDNPSSALTDFIQNFKGKILFIAESAGRREELLEMLNNCSIHPKIVEHWQSWLFCKDPIAICTAPLDTSFIFFSNDEAICLITEHQIFGKRASQRRRRTKSTDNINTLINNLTDLSINSPVVHETNGIGRYKGLQTINIQGMPNEFLTLEYADNDKLYVPVSSLHLISRYTGASAESAPLHKLGGEQWQRIKHKAAKKIRDIAIELLDVNAKRAARTGHAHPENTAETTAFTALFPFEETPDQQTAIDDVMQDLHSSKPMDRVVCGDVGFGKTEVAMRAAFNVAFNSKQVAILVPTTLLAQQHYQNFTDRFANWPIKIECLSRFSTKKEQSKIINELHKGIVDIVIGTHKILQNDIQFKDLGLIIIDEEHRFGVRHKETLKKLRTEVDILTLTATPIPRTLNMAMSGLRDLSIIATPPENRNSIKTFINEWNDDLIHEACQREIKRGGQIYFVHNSVDTIKQTASKLEIIIPEARIAIAHGQLPERELETIMLDFYHQQYNLLICTTIIESGIDVPTANTIIINRADKFGLAQLHQLRGRVGRSHHNAYAYLVIPPKAVITADAVKRLEAIESLENLGSGFVLASHDLEIRGAGELLGDEQSGQIQEIGFSLYTEMLERAVQALKSGSEPVLEKPLKVGTEIDLGIPALLPGDYIPDVHHRLVQYKRIANAANREELRELQVEFIDRFGLLPDTAKNLFQVTELKLKCIKMGIIKIDVNHAGGRIEFENEPDINTYELLQLIQNSPEIYIFDGKNKLRFNTHLEQAKDRVDFLDKLLDKLRNKSC